MKGRRSIHTLQAVDSESRKRNGWASRSITRGFYLPRKIAYPPLGPVIARGIETIPRILEHNHTEHVYTVPARMEHTGIRIDAFTACFRLYGWDNGRRSEPLFAVGEEGTRNRPLTVSPKVTRLPSSLRLLLLSLVELLRLPPPPPFRLSSTSSLPHPLLPWNPSCSKLTWPALRREQRFIPRANKRNTGLAGIGGCCVRLSVLFFFVSTRLGGKKDD